MKIKLFIIELVMGIVIAMLVLPTVYVVQEINRRFFSIEPYEFRGSMFIDIWVVGLSLVLITSALIISVLIFHIPISFYLRNRFKKPKFKFLLPVIIALSTYFMFIFIGIFAYWVVSGDFQLIANNGLISADVLLIMLICAPSLLPIFLPPLLTALIFGKTFEYCES